MRTWHHWGAVAMIILGLVGYLEGMVKGNNVQVFLACAVILMGVLAMTALERAAGRNDAEADDAAA